MEERNEGYEGNNRLILNLSFLQRFLLKSCEKNLLTEQFDPSPEPLIEWKSRKAAKKKRDEGKSISSFLQVSLTYVF